MIQIHPSEIRGAWKAGFVLDKHVVSSTHMGMNESGHDVFETTRSEAGDLLFKLKYRGHTPSANGLIEAAVDFLSRWAPPVDVIVAVPSSTQRSVQPVPLIASGIAVALGKPFLAEAVSKTKVIPAVKNTTFADRLELLKDAFGVDTRQVNGKSVLLIDDLYQSGASMNAVTQALYEVGSATVVYVLAMTRTRSYS